MITIDACDLIIFVLIALAVYALYDEIKAIKKLREKEKEMYRYINILEDAINHMKYSERPENYSFPDEL